MRRYPQRRVHDLARAHTEQGTAEKYHMVFLLKRNKDTVY